MNHLRANRLTGRLSFYVYYKPQQGNCQLGPVPWGWSFFYGQYKPFWKSSQLPGFCSLLRWILFRQLTYLTAKQVQLPGDVFVLHPPSEHVIGGVPGVDLASGLGGSGASSQRCFGTAVRKPARCETLGTGLCPPEGSRCIPPGEIPGSTQDSFPPLRLVGKTTRPTQSSPQWAGS